MSMEFEPNVTADRPEILDSRVMMHRPERTVEYVEIGDTSPEMTNHMSRLDITVLNGIGAIATVGMVSSVGPGSLVTIPAGHKHAFGGKLDLLVTSTPPTFPSFVTLGDEKLGSLQQMMLREQTKKAQRAAREKAAVERFMALSQKYTATLELMIRAENYRDQAALFAGR